MWNWVIIIQRDLVFIYKNLIIKFFLWLLNYVNIVKFYLKVNQRILGKIIALLSHTLWINNLCISCVWLILSTSCDLKA
jgi:hypothetical protein